MNDNMPVRNINHLVEKSVLTSVLRHTHAPTVSIVRSHSVIAPSQPSSSRRGAKPARVVRSAMLVSWVTPTTHGAAIVKAFARPGEPKPGYSYIMYPGLALAANRVRRDYTFAVTLSDHEKATGAQVTETNLLTSHPIVVAEAARLDVSGYGIGDMLVEFDRLLASFTSGAV